VRQKADRQTGWKADRHINKTGRPLDTVFSEIETASKHSKLVVTMPIKTYTKELLISIKRTQEDRNTAERLLAKAI
jgi:hypothetical protein